jgi:hypothetical protein
MVDGPWVPPGGDGGAGVTGGRTAAGGPGDELASESDYEDALAAVADLDRLRDDIDSRTQPAALTEAPFASEVFDRYSEAIEAVHDADLRLRLTTIDDPELRRGAELLAEGQRALDAAERLPLVIAGNGGILDAPEAIATTTAIRADLDSSRAAVTELAAGTDYEVAADQLDAALAEAGLEDVLDEALATQRLDMSRLVAALGPASGAWQTFIGEVDGRLTREIGSS